MTHRSHQPALSHFSRRNLLRAAGALGLTTTASGLLAACGGDDDGGGDGGSGGSGGGETVRLSVALGWIMNVEFAGFWVADDQGFYADEGLEIEFQAGGPNAPDPTQSVSSDAADIGVHPNMQTVMTSIPAGNDFVIAGTVFQTSPGGLLSLADDPVLTPEDLVGATVLGQEGVQPTIEAVLSLNNLPNDYDFVPVGFDPSPLVQGQGTAYTCFITNQPISLEEQYDMVQGEDFEVVTYADLGLPSYSNLVFCKRSFHSDQPDVMERFMRATVRGWQHNAADPELAARLAVENYGADLGLDLNQQIRENELQIPLTQSDLTESEGLFRIDVDLLGGAMFDALRASGVDELPDATRIVDQGVLDAVYANGTTL
jgi:ABC-type nitrate/sulfonate/bicarbonate transport system substrate-binding protein